MNESMPDDLVVWFDAVSEGEYVVTQAPFPDDEAGKAVWQIRCDGELFAVAGSRTAAIREVIELIDGSGVWRLGPEAGMPRTGIAIRSLRGGGHYL